MVDDLVLVWVASRKAPVISANVMHIYYTCCAQEHSNAKEVNSSLHLLRLKPFKCASAGRDPDQGVGVIFKIQKTLIQDNALPGLYHDFEYILNVQIHFSVIGFLF